jgi:hypothetical protein
MVTLRGYDRDQVDQYVDRQAALLAEARRRLDQAELAGADPRGVPDASPVARPKALTASPRSFEELGDQVARILREAWRAAEEIRAAARQDASALLEEARARASTPKGAEHRV